MKSLSKSDIRLSEIFSEKEIEEIQKATINYIDEDNTLIGKDVISKDKFSKILFKIIKGKFKQNNEEIFLPFINWLEKEKNSFYESQFKALQKENEELNRYLKWIDDNCIIKHKKLNLNKTLFNGNLKQQYLTIKDIKNIVKPKSKNTSDSVLVKSISDVSISNNNTNIKNKINLINISEDAISKIETPEFDIFKLEKEVGPENTLTVVGCYIMSAYDLYSIVNYKKFEKYIQIITKGYIRENPYHNVKYFLI